MKYRNLIGAVLVLLIVGITTYGCAYMFKWLNKRDEIIPTDRSLGYDLSTYVGVDTDFVLSALERDGITFMDVTEPEQKAQGYKYLAMRENIQGLDFVTTLIFMDPMAIEPEEPADDAENGEEGETAEATETEESAAEEEVVQEEGGVSGLINRIPLPGARSDVARCVGYVKRWDSSSNEWTSMQMASANGIFSSLVDKYGALNKDNQYTKIKVQSGEKYTPEKMPEEVLAEYDQGIVVSENLVAFRGAWIKTFLNHSFGDKCVRFRYGRTGEDKHVFVEILHYASAYYPYKQSK
ncbi:MAG: hypothetical protein K6A77_09280 [Clostridiales bacterium]|nr:hypothetical protein [Clostridiales bacterium]